MVSLGAFGGAASVNILINAVDNFSSTFNSAESSMKSFSTAALSVGTAFAAVGVAATIFGVEAVKSAASFETSMSNVETLLVGTDEDMEALANSTQSLASEFGLAGGELEAAAGLYQTVSAGITDTATATAFLEEATKASIGGSAELSSVIEASTKTMAAFGIEAEDSGRVFDVFAATVAAGQTTMDQLASAFPRVSASAGEMGVSLEETAGIFAGLTKVMASPEQAATALNSTLTKLIKPTKEMQEALEFLGFESGQAAIEELGLVGTLESLADVVGDDTESLAKLFNSEEALRAVLPLLGAASDDVAASIESVSDSTGMAQSQFEIMSGTSENLFNQMKNTIGSAMTDIGDSILTELLPVITPLTEKFQTLINTITESEVFTGLMDTFAGALQTVTDTATTFVEELDWELLKETTEKMFNFLIDNKDDITSLFSNMATFTGNILESFVGMVNILIESGYLEDILSLFVLLADALAIVSDALTDVYDIIKDINDMLSDSFLGTFSESIPATSLNVATLGMSGLGQQAGNLLQGGDTEQLLQTTPDNFQLSEPNQSDLSGMSVMVQIENVNGLDADVVAEALQSKLSTMISY